jgi:PAS domain S-box-containing protein
MGEVESHPKVEMSDRARQLFHAHESRIHRRCDRMFARLFVIQWAAGLIAACWLSPRAWAGAESYVHPHIWAAFTIGTVLLSVPLFLVYHHPGGTLTRHVVAAAQMMFSGLLIHLSGGRIETHFHIFGSLAFLAFYRDWRVLATATAVTGLDHVLRGTLAPESLFGVATASPWRAFEHIGWVLFTDYFLVGASLRSRREMVEIAVHQSENESATATAKADRDDLLVALNAGTIVARTDATGHITYVNDHLCDLSGHTREELLGQPMSILESGQHPPEFWEEMIQRISRGELWRGEVRNKTKDGRHFWVSASIKGFTDAKGRLTRAVHVQTDITAEKEAELHRGQAARLESIGQLAAGIAHEINTPTQYVGDNVRFTQEGFTAVTKAMTQYEELLAEGPGRPWADRQAVAANVRRDLDLDFLRGEVPQAISQALEGLERVTLIVGAMKDFSHPGTTQKEPADLNRAIVSTVEVCRNRWKYIADLQTDLQADLPPVPCLVAEFNQVVLNLIVNAADALSEVVPPPGAPPHKATIHVASRVTPDGQWAEVTVADNGPGIPERVQARIFEPFFTTKPLGKGTGQGLTLSRDVIVNKHGGSLTFRSSPAGTTFTIRLPLVAPVEMERLAA